MYRHILIPTDGSELSNRAIEYAADLATAVNAKLTVFTAMEERELVVSERCARRRVKYRIVCKAGISLG